MNDIDAVTVASQRLGIVLSSTGSPDDIEGVLNPGIVRDRAGTLIMYPRMVAAGNISRIGISVATEGEGGPLFAPPDVLLAPHEPYELRPAPGYGCEDPRVTFIPRLNLFAMAYAAYGPTGPRIAVAVSDDARSWSRLGLLKFAHEPLNAVPNKDAAFFPEPVLSPAGIPSIAIYHRPMLAESLEGQAPIAFVLSLPPEQREVLCVAYIPLDDALRDPAALCRAQESASILPTGDRWGTYKNGAGTPPVRTACGWLSFFHGVDVVERDGVPTLMYRAGMLLHDLDRPDRIVYRSPRPLLDPETPDERFGTVNDVVFPTGIDVVGDGSYDVYYGAADARIARARFEVAGRD
jgi:predicted GH43/DUF377 family glycosyl hydrolase